MRGFGGAMRRGNRCVLVGARAQIEAAVLDLQIDGLELVGACALDESADVIAALPSLGPLESLASALTLVRADSVVWAAAPANRTLARQCLDASVRAGCAVLVAETIGERPHLRALMLDDLLGAPRETQEPARLSVAFSGKRILVTGGGGSIGAELMRRLAAFAPARLVALDSSELNLFNLQHDPMLADAEGVGFVYADVRDPDDLRRIFAREQPDIVFHAAALKHVPIVEAHPSQGVRTNVLGTVNVAEICAEQGAAMVFVSTDKAVQPKSVMGATKRLAGFYCRARDLSGDLRAIAVRLGNVLGSAGSVAPLFERQAANGGPITITHPEAQRFFVTVAQAADFLMQAAAVGLAPDAPRGAAYVLGIEEEVSIVELARDIILLSGLRPDIDVPIRYVGLRPGEKVREALVAEDELMHATAAHNIHALEGALPSLSELNAAIARIAAAAQAGEDEAVRALLQEAVGVHPSLQAAAG